MDESRLEIEFERLQRVGRPGCARRQRLRARIRRDAANALALLWVTVTLAGCQSYQPRPLDSAAHREAWHGRTLEEGSLGPFLDRPEFDALDQDGEFDPADGLSLHEGRLVAIVFSPRLRLARLGVARAAAGAENAGSWMDPELSLDLMRISENVPEPWVITPGLSFSIPLSGRLAVERDLAEAQLRVAQGAAREAEWSVWHEVETAWIEWSAATLRVEETQRLVEAMDGLVETAAQLADRGELLRTEASLLRVEQAQRNNKLWRLRAEVGAFEQGLRALMGLAPEAPVDFVPTLARDSDSPDIEAGLTGPALIEARNPSLARLRLEYEVSEETLRGEIKKQVPDLSLGPKYESDQGQSRVGFLGGIPIPLLNANRGEIAEARAEREIARATLETTYEALVGRWAAAAARAEALTRQRAEMEQVLVPLVDRQLADTDQLLRLGEGTSATLLASLTHAHQTKLDLIETRAAEALARAELTYLIGPATAGWPFDKKYETP